MIASPKTLAERHDRRKAWFLDEAARQATNRAIMARCEAFYDGQQWTYEDAETVRGRGQNPVVYNEIKPSIDWLIGTERRTRVDFFIVADEPGEEAEQDAQNKTKLMKYLDEVNRTSFERSYAANEAFKAGLGWMEVGLRGDKTGSPIFVGSESWRNILYDSRASKRDLSDARYIFRIKVVDADVAVALFPDKKKEIEECIQTGDDAEVFREWMGGTGLLAGLDAFNGQTDEDLDYLTPKPVDMFNSRERVLLLECWSREPVRNTKANAHGIADPVTFRMHCSIMTEKHTLHEAVSPFNHDRFPFIPVWAYRNSRTGLPYSPTLQLMGPQESLNQRMARSLFEASANQIKIEVGAFDADVMDLEEIRKELDSPDGMAVFADGALSGNKVQERDNLRESKAQMEHANRDIGAIRGMSGVSGEQRGLDTNSVSGKAVLAKQEQGGLLTMELFDNLMYARQIEGELTLSVAEQFITGPMTVRNRDDSGRAQFTQINQYEAATGKYINDITARKAHFTIGEQAWKQSFAEAAFEGLMSMMTQLAAAAPQVVINLLDVVFEMHPNLPRKEAILKRIRSVNGQTSPDGKLTPEQQQEHQQKQAVAKAQFDAQMAMIQAEIREAQAKGEKLEAEAMGKRLEALYMAAQGAQVLAMAPGIAPVADEMLVSAGFKDMGGGGVLDMGAMPQPGQPAPGGPPQLGMGGMEQPMDQGMPPEPPIQEPMQADGSMQGIETMAPDGVNPSLQ